MFFLLQLRKRVRSTCVDIEEVHSIEFMGLELDELLHFLVNEKRSKHDNIWNSQRFPHDLFQDIKHFLGKGLLSLIRRYYLEIDWMAGLVPALE